MDVEEELRDYINELEGELENQEEETDKLGKESIKYQDKIADLQVQLKQLRLDNDDLIGEKTQLEEHVKSHRSQLDAQKSILAVAAKTSEEAKRHKKDGNQQLHRLELENQRLRATVFEIEENEDILVNEIDTLVKEKSEFQEQSEDLSSKCDALYADLDEKTRANSQLLQEKEKAQSDLDKGQAAYAKGIEELQRKDAASKAEITRLLLELEQERAKHKESAHIQENEAFRVELREIRKEKQKLHSLHDQCLLDKNQAERDLDHTIQALGEFKRNAKEQTASVARKQRGALAESTAKLDRTTAKLDNALKKCNDTDEQLEDLRKQLEQSEGRNSSYEKKHGLTEAIRAIRQLEAGIRRRDYDMKRLNHAMGVDIEKRRSLTKACDWLKEKANVGPDFKFDDDEIKVALRREDNRLQCENVELSRQIEALEGERTKLLSQLRERSIEIGEKGIRYLGMSSDQVAQVMEFASNLRNGIADLPLNDRSKVLMSEVSSLKSHREVDRITIERFEREMFALSEAAKEPYGEGVIIKQALDNMAVENQKLRDEIDILKETSSGNPNGSALTPLMRGRVEEILGEDLVQMPANAELQFVLILKQHERVAQELALLTKTMEKRGTEQRAVTYREGEKPGNDHASDSRYCRDSAEAFLNPSIDVGDTSRNEKLMNVMSSMQRAMKDLRNERDLLSSQLSQLGELQSDQPSTTYDRGQISQPDKCKPLEDALQSETQARIIAERDLAETRTSYSGRILFLETWKLNATEALERAKINGDSNSVLATAGLLNVRQGSQEEIEKWRKPNNSNGMGKHDDSHAQMKESLQQTQNKLSGYINDVTNLRSTIFAMQENRIDSAKVAMQISCLNDIIRQKNRIIKEGQKKLTTVKQLNLQLSRDRGFHQHKSDRSISTSSLDKSILRAARNPGQSSPTRNHMQRSLEEATKLVFEKEATIEDQNQTILELNQELASTKESYQQVMEEAESMKTDISTLVSKLSEAEAAVTGIEAYQQKLGEIQGSMAKDKKESNALKSKLGELTKDGTEKNAKIKELQESSSRSKRMMMVTRQSRARSEQNLKALNEEITALKEQLEKMGSQMNALKKEKVDAQNAKLKLSQKARISATKLKDLIEEKKNSKTVEELDKRVNVLNKTVSGLATQNSKLRGELAAYKLSLKKKMDNEATAEQITPPVTRRSIVSRERPTSSRSKSLEAKMKSLQSSLLQEKKHVLALEQALQSATGRNKGDEVKDSALKCVDSSSELQQQQVLSLTNENKSLKRRMENIKTDGSMLKVENDKLKKENERLSQIDHLDFFEEIEDLKYKYNEAVRQINQLTTGL